MPIPHRRLALTTLVLVLVPWSLLRVLAGLLPLPGVDPERVVNGMLVPPAGVVGALLEPVVWAWAVTAAVAAMAPLDRPLRRAFRALPTVCAALLAGVGTLLVAFLLLGMVLPAAEELVWVVAALLALPVAALLVRFALVLPIAVLDGRRGREAFRASFVGVRGNALGLGVALLFGVAAPALLHGWAFARLEEQVTDHLLGVLAWLLRDATLVAVVALQASTLLVAHRNLAGRSLPSAPSPEEPAPAADGLTRRLGRLTVPLGLAAVLLPAGLVGGVVAAERLPEVTVNTSDRAHRMIAVGWPAGRGPILVGQSWFDDCLDDTCRTRRRTDLSVMMYEPYGGAAFGADGSVYALGQHELEQCDVQRICRRGEGGLAVLRGTQAAAITLAPAGEILLASAMEIKPAAPTPDHARHVELKLIRCPDVFCVNPRVASLGLVAGSLSDRDGSRPTRLVVRIDENGRPVVVFRSPSTGAVSVGWCATLACARPEIAPLEGPGPLGMPTPEDLALLDLGDVLDCRTGHGCDDVQPLATVHRPRGGVWDVVVEPVRPEGLYLRVGSDPWPGRATLRICADRSCREPEGIPLVEVPPVQTVWSDRPARERWLMAVDGDDRMVVTDPYGQRVVVVIRP
ncbi:hypothetical protein ACFOW4_22785 [Micromonospora sp. GCM10011542]|uniref:hypothetical protein n=1 Tax=Micromonospora sp. GCM10011542 TaxID=3317337 RepID=UPI0036114397